MKFLKCLFNVDEFTCFSETPRGIAISQAWQPFKEEAFFSINPMDRNKTRSDSAVILYRNILIEIDKMPVEHQQAHIQGMQMPYSTAVFSGSKSVHYIISLETPLENEALYRALVKRVYKAVGDSIVDQSCKNPSRFSRLPGHIRSDTGREQQLLAINSRVPNSVLEEWLLSRGVGPEDIWENLTPEKRSEYKNPSRLRGTTKNFLMFGADQGEWNHRLFSAAADLCRCGYNIIEAGDELVKITGTLDAFDNRTIASAYKNEESKNG